MVKKVEAAPVTDQRQVILELEAEWAVGEIEGFNGAQREVNKSADRGSQEAKTQGTETQGKMN